MIKIDIFLTLYFLQLSFDQNNQLLNPKLNYLSVLFFKDKIIKYNLIKQSCKFYSNKIYF